MLLAENRPVSESDRYKYQICAFVLHTQWLFSSWKAPIIELNIDCEKLFRRYVIRYAEGMNTASRYTCATRIIINFELWPRAWNVRRRSLHREIETSVAVSTFRVAWNKVEWILVNLSYLQQFSIKAVVMLTVNILCTIRIVMAVPKFRLPSCLLVYLVSNMSRLIWSDWYISSVSVYYIFRGICVGSIVVCNASCWMSMTQIAGDNMADEFFFIFSLVRWHWWQIGSAQTTKWKSSPTYTGWHLSSPHHCHHGAAEATAAFSLPKNKSAYTCTWIMWCSDADTTDITFFFFFISNSHEIRKTSYQVRSCVSVSSL